MTINWEVIIWTCITLAVLMSVIGLILYAISAKNVRSKRKELGDKYLDAEERETLENDVSMTSAAVQ